MDRADAAALDQRPESFDGLRMDIPVNVFPLTEMHHAMRDRRVELAIPAMIVGRKQADVIGDGFMHEAIQCCSIGALYHASHHVSLTLNGTDDDELACSACAAEVSASTFPFVFVFRFPAHIGFATST